MGMFIISSSSRLLLKNPESCNELFGSAYSKGKGVSVSKFESEKFSIPVGYENGWCTVEDASATAKKRNSMEGHSVTGKTDQISETML